MNSKALSAIITTLIGCILNNIVLEYIIKIDPGCGHLITFAQFLFVSLYGIIFTSKFFTVKPKIPLSEYLILDIYFFLTSVINNWAFNFHIPIPLHMIFRSGSLIANMILGKIILNKKYTMDKYVSVSMITLGIILCTLESSKTKITKCIDCDLNNIQNEPEIENHLFWWIIGIILLTAALLLSARMGIYQEMIYKKHGKHPEEALFYTHLCSLPGFIFYSSSIIAHIRIGSNSTLIELPYLNIFMPIIWCLLFLNVITQYLCIKSVYILTTECSSLTVTLVVTLRKFFSLVFSIIYFSNPFTIVHWWGTILVFFGTLLFTEVPTKIKNSLLSSNNNSNTNLKKIN